MSIKSMALIWQIEEKLSVAFLAIVVMLVFIAAILRWIGYPVIWAVEMPQLIFIWACMLGANQALRRGEHVGVDIIVRHYPIKVRLCLDVLLNILIAAFLVFLVVYGVELTQLNVERTLGSTDVSYSLVTAAVPVGAGLLLVTTIIQTLTFAKLILQAEINEGDLSAAFLTKYRTEGAKI